MALLDLVDAAADHDLRDARLWAWLLDPAGAHGGGLAALNGLGVVLAERGAEALSKTLAAVPPPPCETTVRLRKGEVEVLVTAAALKVVLVWRSAPAPYAGAIEFAAADGALAAGVMRVPGLFPPETVATFPVLAWADVARSLQHVAVTPEHTAMFEQLGQRLARQD